MSYNQIRLNIGQIRALFSSCRIYFYIISFATFAVLKRCKWTKAKVGVAH